MSITAARYPIDILPAWAEPTPLRSELPAVLEDDVILGAEEFSLQYRNQAALTSVTLAIPARRITAIIGPAGCGKSTLLRAFNRMNDPIRGVRTRGRVWVSGLGVLSSSTDLAELRRRVGMVFQNSRPFPTTTFENVAFGLRMMGITKRPELELRVEQSLRQVALWDEIKDRLHRPALELQGGEQQRLGIARCLAVDPEVILMDEPTSTLDPVATARIEELILDLRSRITLVIATPNIQQAARISDHAAVLIAGKLIEFDHTAILLTRPRRRLTEDYLTGRLG